MVKGETALKSNELEVAYSAFRSASWAEDFQGAFFTHGHCDTWEEPLSNTIVRMLDLGKNDLLYWYLKNESVRRIRTLIFSEIGGYGGKDEIYLLIQAYNDGILKDEDMFKLIFTLETLSGAASVNFTLSDKSDSSESYCKKRLPNTLEWINNQNPNNWSQVIHQQITDSIKLITTCNPYSELRAIRLIAFCQKQLGKVYPNPHAFKRLTWGEEVKPLSKELSSWWKENFPKLEWDSKKGQMVWKKGHSPVAESK